MTFDKEQQRKIILELLKVGTFSGNSLDELYEFKQTVLKAEITKQEEQEDGKKV